MLPIPLRALAPLLVLLAAIGVLWGTYLAGYNSADDEWTLKWERHQGALMQANAERTSKALQAMADRHSKQARTRAKFNEIMLPDTRYCTDPDWLRAHNDTVRAANGTP